MNPYKGFKLIFVTLLFEFAKIVVSAVSTLF